MLTFKFGMMRVLQLELQIALKTNAYNRETQLRQEMTKEMEREQQKTSEARSQMDSMKNIINGLRQEIKQLNDLIGEQKVFPVSL